MINFERSLDIVTWQDVRQQVQLVNPDLASCIDAMQPDHRFRLIKVRYLYGDIAVDNGIVQLPNRQGDLVPFTDTGIEQKISNLLNYSQIPLMLNLLNDNEVYIENQRVIPLNLFKAGSLLGLFETLDALFGQVTTQARWCVSAGSRNLFTLPKINDEIGLRRLRAQFDIPLTLRVKHMSDHWELFRLLAQHESFPQTWHNDVLYFTSDWFHNVPTTPAWAEFKDYLFQRAWEQAKFAMGKVDLSLSWELFSEMMSKRNLRLKPYIADQFKHILSICAGKSPGFRVIADQSSAPIAGLKTVLTDIYQLKHYWPTMMHAAPMTSITDSDYLYYSLSFPTLLEGTPHKANAQNNTIMNDLRLIHYLITSMQQYGQTHSNTTLDLLKHVDFNYFHTEHDAYGDIMKASKVLEDQPAFATDDQQHFPDRQFCQNSQFFRGCIRFKQEPRYEQQAVVGDTSLAIMHQDASKVVFPPQVEV